MKTPALPRLLRTLCGGALLAAALLCPGLGRAGTETAAAAPDAKEIAVPNPPADDWTNRKYLTGDWGGERTRLADKGLTINLAHIGNLQADVAGSQDHHVEWFGRFRLTVDLNLQKMADYDGEFFFTGVYQYGRNLNAGLNVNTLVSPIAGEEFLGIDEAWYQQGFWDGRIKLKVGQIAGVNEFGATDFGDVFLSDELSYAPNGIFQAGLPFSPPGKPGAIIKFDLRDVVPGLYTKFGGFTSVVNAYRPDRYGVDYNDDFRHGATIAGEIGYVEPGSNYAGTYKAGFIGTDTDHFHDYAAYAPGNAYSGEPLTGNYVAYAMIEKSVYHPRKADGTLDKARGLDLLGEGLYSPGDRNLIQYEGTFGARYTGLFAGRPKDKAGLGLIYSQAGHHASDAYAAANGGHLGGETTVELAYSINVTDWLQVEPNLQEIFNPRGDNNRSDITVLQLDTVVSF